MDSHLTSIEDWVQPLIDNLTSAEKRKLTRKIAISLRKENIDRIKKQTNPDGSKFTERKPRLREKNGRIKRKKTLFANLRKTRHLKISNDATGLAVGYSGRAAAIAKIHHYGLLARVSPNGVLYRYAVRKLIGLNDADRDLIYEHLQKHLSQ